MGVSSHCLSFRISKMYSSMGSWTQSRIVTSGTISRAAFCFSHRHSFKRSNLQASPIPFCFNCARTLSANGSDKLSLLRIFYNSTEAAISIWNHVIFEQTLMRSNVLFQHCKRFPLRRIQILVVNLTVGEADRKVREI